MKSKGILLAVGLAVAGLVTAVVLLSKSSRVLDSTPQGVDRELASSSAPVVSLASPASTLETPPPAALEVREHPLAAEERSEVAAPVIRGRVVEAESRLPRTGIELQLKSRSELLATTVSDAAGRFELPFSNASRLAVELVEPEGWQAVLRRHGISGSQPPTEELVFELRRVPGVVFHGRAIDEASRDPLPYLNLELGSFGQSEPVESDGEGLFTTKQPYKAGSIEVALVTAAGGGWLNSEHTIKFDGSSRIVDVPIPIGPTYKLDIAPPLGYALEDLRAFLPERSESSPWSLSLHARDGETVHPASPPWVRFLSFDPDIRSELGTLWVCTTDSRWLGSCKVPLRSSGPHQIVLVPCGSLEISITQAHDQRQLEVVAELRFTGETESWGARGGIGGTGSLRFDLVPPGDYLLSVKSNRTEPLERSVRVAAGEPTVVDVALQPLPHGGTIRGFARSESGRFRINGSVGLRPMGQHSDTFGTEVLWTEEGGKFVGHFAFDDVPVGEYELSARMFGHFPWRASPSTVSPPATDVELLCLDGAGGIHLEVEAYDASTNEPLTEISVSFDTSSEGRFWHRRGGSNRIDLGRFPRDFSIDWEATCNGYIAVAGNLSTFQPTGTKDGEPLLRARVELQPGWGGRVLACTETERIEGAVVLCDDIEIGRTNERGELDIVLPARPKRFEVRHPSFVMDTPATGEVPDDAVVLLCYMKPRE